MTDNQIPLAEFLGQLESSFGKKLTPQATLAATDFWEHWDSFADLISRRQLSLRVDPFFLARNFSRYRRYQTWKGGGIVLLLFGFASVWFFWPLGVCLLLVGIGFGLYGNRVRYNDAKAFAEEIMQGATMNPAETGYAKLCAHYIAGIVSLTTPTASVDWPQFPSNIVTGAETLIDTTQGREDIQ